MALSPYAVGEPVQLEPVTSRREAAALRDEARRQFVAARDAGEPWSDEVVAATQRALAEVDVEAQAVEDRRRLARKVSNWWQQKQHDAEYVAACERRAAELQKAVAA